MPIYEYQCQACGHRLEALQKFDEPALKKCPECSKMELNKMVSASSFHLKGTGWYATDFKDNKKESQPVEKTTASSESTPEVKAETTDKKTPAPAVKDKKTTE